MVTKIIMRLFEVRPKSKKGMKNPKDKMFFLNVLFYRQHHQLPNKIEDYTQDNNIQESQMMMKIKLDDVIEQIEFASESNKSFFNKETCEIHLIPDEVEMYTDYDIEDDFIPEWEKELIPIAKDIQRNPEN